MTIPSTTRKAGPYTGNGVQTAWPFTFKCFSADDVAVKVYTPLTGETVLTPGTYTVTLNANQDTSPGGSITYPLSGALSSTATLTILGAVPFDQPLDLPSGGQFNPAALENQLDRTVMQVQQLAEQQSRALTLPITSSASAALPTPEAAKFLAWNSDGTALRNADGSDISVEIAFSDWTYDTDTGDGTKTAFALTKPPGNIANLDLSVDGVTLVPGVDFTLFSNVVTFTTAPANGAQILARYGRNAEQLPVEVLNAVQGPFLQLDNTISYDFTLTPGKNALAISPTINAGVTVTVPSGSKFITLDEYAGSGTADLAGANLGGGTPVFDSKSGTTLNFRSLLAGGGISLTSSAGGATTIGCTVTPGETNTASNLGGGVPIFDSKSGVDLRFRSLLAGSGINLATTPGGATTISSTVTPGEVNTASNVGTGTGVLYKTKVGADLQFKTLKAGGNITLTNNTDDVTITAPAPGEVNTASNAGVGEGTLYQAKIGTNLFFKTLKAGTNISITNGTNEVTINASGGASGETNTASNLGGTYGWYVQKSGVDLQFRGITAGSGVSLSATSSAVTISTVVISSSDPGAVGAGVIWVTP